MIDFKTEKLIPLCEAFGFELTNEAVKRLNIYGNLLLEWNEKINLTAIKEPEAVLYKHFYDCLLTFKHFSPLASSSIIDVGTGAGFPGLVFKIARPDLEITLLDSLNKRVNFLNTVLGELSLKANTLHSRAEEAARNPLYREKYDFATARAVAALPVLSEYCLPFVKKGGSFIALKGPSGEEELKNAANAISLLGGKKDKIICEALPENEQRTLIFIKKISQTPPKYPRISTKISKQPL